MALSKPYLDVPGTTIFDTEQARLGYHLNQFCMSLMKADNRTRFKANERAYLDEWAMSEDQKQAVLTRDMNRMHLAGRQHLLLGQDWRHRRQELSADGGQHDRHDRRGVPQHDDCGWAVGGGQPGGGRGRRRADAPPTARCRRAPCPSQRRGAQRSRAAHRAGGLTMAKITASVYTSHVPAIGAALDHGKTKNPTGHRCSRATSIQSNG